MQLFQTYPPPQIAMQSLRASCTFLYFFSFLILLFGQLGDQCVFAVIVSCFSASLIFPPLPDHNCTYTTVSLLLRWSRRYGHRVASCMLASTLMLDALVYDDHGSFVLSTVILGADNRTLQTTWTLFALSKMGGERLSSRVMSTRALFEITKWSSVAPRSSFTPPSGFFCHQFNCRDEWSRRSALSPPRYQTGRDGVKGQS